jgi:tRNA modification GTPase
MLAEQSASRRIVVLTKCDLPALIVARQSRLHSAGETPARKIIIEQPLRTSSLRGEGIEDLRRRLRAACLAARSAGAEAVVGTADRCRESLRRAAKALRRAKALAGQSELAAEEIRAALNELGKVVGAVHADDLLDRVFSRFCIGK